MFKLYSFYRKYILRHTTVDPDLFICTTETFIYSDLLHLEGEIPITYYDTCVSVSSLLNIPLDTLPYEVRYNRILLYRAVYDYFYDLCDWNQLHINTGYIPTIKIMLRRLKHHIGE